MVTAVTLCPRCRDRTYEYNSETGRSKCSFCFFPNDYDPYISDLYRRVLQLEIKLAELEEPENGD